MTYSFFYGSRESWKGERELENHKNERSALTIATIPAGFDVANSTTDLDASSHELPRKAVNCRDVRFFTKRILHLNRARKWPVNRTEATTRSRLPWKIIGEAWHARLCVPIRANQKIRSLLFGKACAARSSRAGGQETTRAGGRSGGLLTPRSQNPGVSSSLLSPQMGLSGPLSERPFGRTNRGSQKINIWRTHCHGVARTQMRNNRRFVRTRTTKGYGRVDGEKRKG